MSGDSKDDVYIPVIFLYHSEGQSLLDMIQNDPDLEVVMAAKLESMGKL